MQKNIIWLKFTINYSLFKLNYNWRHCSAISLTVVMLCVCPKRVCVWNNELVCKAVRLALSCQTSAISLPFILIPMFLSHLTEHSRSTVKSSLKIFLTNPFKLNPRASKSDFVRATQGHFKVGPVTINNE